MKSSQKQQTDMFATLMAKVDKIDKTRAAVESSETGGSQRLSVA